MFCEQCGKENDDQARFCQACGANLQPINLGEYAGFWRRFAAYIIDYILVVIPIVIISLIVGFMGGYHEWSEDDKNTALGLVILIWPVIGWIYWAVMESSSKQATVGKMALGIIVTDLRGNRISFGRATGRYWAKSISSLILLIGFIMAAFTAKKQALHDIMAGCLVIIRIKNHNLTQKGENEVKRQQKRFLETLLLFMILVVVVVAANGKKSTGDLEGAF